MAPSSFLTSTPVSVAPWATWEFTFCHISNSARMSNHVLSSSTRYGHYLEILLIFFLCSLNKLKWKWLTFSPGALFSSLNHWTQSWLSIDPSHNRKTRVWPYLNPQRNERLPSLTSLLNQPQESTVFNHFALIFTTPQQDYQAIREKIYDRGYQIKMTLFRQELLYFNNIELCRKKIVFSNQYPFLHLFLWWRM